MAPDPGGPAGDGFEVQIGTVNEAAALLTRTSHPATRKWLVVHFYRDSGEFASAFVPSRAAVDALLRQAATRR